MRRFAPLALFLLIAGCNSDGLPVGGGTSGPGSSSLTDGGSRPDGFATFDLSGPPSGPGLGGMGATCKTACDCDPGLACSRMKHVCTASQLGMVYCCESSTCPNGSFCQSMSGQFSTCGGTGGGGPGSGGGFDLGFGGGGGPGGGGGSFCGFVPCQSDSTCQQVGCGSCDAATMRCQ